MSASILERKIWKIENILNILNTIAIDLSITAAEAGTFGRGISAVANETRKFTMLLERDVFGMLKFEGKAIEDVQNAMEELGSVLRLLGINAILESRRINNMKTFILTDELRKIGESVENLLEPSNFRKNLTMQNPDHSFNEPIPCLVLNIANTYWVENMNSVIEVIKVSKEMMLAYPEGPGKMKHQIEVRGGKIPIVNIHNEMGEDLNITENSRIVILNLGHILYGHSSSDLFFGLLVDDVEYAGFLQKGVHELEVAGNVPMHFVRYAWKTREVGLHFFNWDNIINEHEIRDYRQIENKQR